MIRKTIPACSEPDHDRRPDFRNRSGSAASRRKTTIFKVMKRLGIQAHKRRDADSGNQVVAYMTLPDFERVKQALAVAAPDGDEGEQTATADGFTSAEVGVFYLIQLEPDHDPLHFKVGFAANMNDRLRACVVRHRLPGWLTPGRAGTSGNEQRWIASPMAANVCTRKCSAVPRWIR